MLDKPDINHNQIITAYLERIKQAIEKRKAIKLKKLALQNECNNKNIEFQKLLATNQNLKEQLEKSKIGVRALRELLHAKEHRVPQDNDSAHLRIFSEKR